MRAAHPPDADTRDQVAENIEGQRLAAHFLSRMRVETLDPDELQRAIGSVVREDSPERLRGFCRRLQKKLEAA